MKNITKIVITGGPCGGKSTAMSWIQNVFSQLGYAVIFVSETATELIISGVSAKTCLSAKNFQRYLLELQLKKEDIYDRAAKELKASKVLIVFDRGILDGKAFTPEGEFIKLLDEVNLSEKTVKNRYDTVIHLVTAAKGAEKFYTLDNNNARSETIEQAVLADDKLLEAWNGHKNLKVIDNSTDFSGKMRRLVSEIAKVLGEKIYYNTDRRFEIEYPEIEILEKLSGCIKTKISLAYLTPSENEYRRLREIKIGDDVYYYMLSKKLNPGLEKLETEKRLTKEEYCNILMNSEIASFLDKTRYCFEYRNNSFEIDIFPFWNDKAVLNVLTGESLNNEDIIFPDFIDIVAERTNDPKFRNSFLASEYGSFKKAVF